MGHGSAVLWLAGVAAELSHGWRSTGDTRSQNALWLSLIPAARRDGLTVVCAASGKHTGSPAGRLSVTPLTCRDEHVGGLDVCRTATDTTSSRGKKQVARFII